MVEEVRQRPYSVPPHLLLQQLPEQGLLFLNLDTEEYFGLDEVGTAMYETLLATSSVDDAVGQLAGVYDVSPETLHVDYQKFVNALVERGLLLHEPE